MSQQNESRIFHTAVLKHDVPVDRAHVEQLKRSIRERGQIAPVLVWSEGWAVIDGFHRLTALQELAAEGLTAYAETQTEIIHCDSEAFQDARILSACMHKSVSFARVTLWVQELFLTTKWANRLKASEAFRIGGKQGQYASLKHWGNAMERPVSPLTPDELHELAAWVRSKARVWGLSPDQIANMLALAEIASPLLLPLVSERKSRQDQVLTRPMLREIAQLIPDHSLQEAVAHKARAERLNEQETQKLVEEVVTVPKERLSEVLTTSWLDREKPTKLPTPPMKPNSTLVGLCLATARNLIGWLAKLSEPDVEAEKEELGGVLTGVVISIARYQGHSEDVSEYMQAELGRLTHENKNLRADIVNLKAQLSRAEKLTRTGREIYRQDTA